MTGIDSLKERLLNEDRKKAAEIELEAKKKAEEIISSANEKAQQILDDIKINADKDGKDKRDRLIARAELESRNTILQAKQESIDFILKTTLDRINSMSREEYSDLIKRMLLNNVHIGDEEVVFSVKDKERILIDIDQINKELVTKGKRGLLRINADYANIPSGFILRKNGLEINCTFESLIRGLRDELEADIASVVF